MSQQGLSVFYWGQVFQGSTTQGRIEALRELGCQVTVGSNIELYWKAGRLAFHMARHFGFGPLVSAENRALLEAVDRPYDLIWMDKTCFIRPGTLSALRRWAPLLVHFTPDPMFLVPGRNPLFLKGIPLFDLHATTKAEEVALYERKGARNVLLCSKSYDPAIHHVYPLEEREAFRSDVAFVGAWTPYKESALSKVVQAFPQAQIRVWGPRWAERCRDPLLLAHLGQIPPGIYGADYGRALAAARVGLGLLSWDLAPDEVITDRILEIPACGALLLAPHTEAIASIFKDGEEALLFRSPEEMLERLGWALDHQAECSVIAARGQARVSMGPFRNADVVQKILDAVFTRA